jgi:NHS family nucleoside permease-like MFS transporter
MGIVADRWIPAQKLLGICHGIAGILMLGAGFYGVNAGDAVEFGPLFGMYALSVAFYMPTIALSNAVAFNALVKGGFDTVKDYPPIRVFGTVGFIAMEVCVDAAGLYTTAWQFVVSGALSAILAVYSFTLPNCDIKKVEGKVDLVDALGLRAFALFKQKKMALFFIFCMGLGVSLQITNGFANPFLGSFAANPEFAEAFAVKHSNILISISQACEAICILFIPFFLKRFGIKNVMLLAMFAWVLRFAFFGLGDPGMPGVLLFVLSCVVYGFAFDFFNISGALYVDQETDESMRSSAQGLFMVMTNGVGATIGTLAAQAVVNKFVYHLPETATFADVWHGWNMSWYTFAAYALFVAIAFWIFFPKTPVNKDIEIKH